MQSNWGPGHKLLGRFEILHKIGAGGMGQVFRAVDTRGSREYAVKTYHGDIFRNPDLVRRFDQEADTWIRLGRHPHIVEVEFVEKHQGRLCIFMEYIEGAPLDRLLETYNLPIGLAVAFGIQFCRGMVHAREVVPAIVHRDIKPANTLVASNGVLKITDWGLAKTVQEASGHSLGTYPYSSPEQLTNPGAVDTRSDIYSFGVMLYEMLAGRRPLAARRASDIAAWAHCHLHETPKRPSHHRTDLPVELDELVMHCLEKDPASRPRSFRDLGKELESLYEKLTGQRVVVDQPPGSPYERLCNEAVSWIARRRYAEAEASCRKAIDLDPQRSVAWLNLGIALKESGRYQEALDAYDEALVHDPEEPLTWNNRGNVLDDLQRAEEALASFDRALALDPRYDRAWNNKGWTLVDLCQRFDEALDCFDRAVAINPNYADAYNNRGVALAHLDRDEDALESIVEALDIDPSNVKALANQAGQLIALGRLAEAAESCRRALQVDPDTYAALNNLALVLRNTGQPEEALRQFDRAIAVHTEGTPHAALANKGDLLADLGRSDEALPCLRQATAAMPDNGQYATMFAQALLLHGDLADARRSYERAIELSVSDPLLHYNFGVLLAGIGEHREAAQQFRAAIERNAEYPQAYNNLGASLYKLGDFTAAEKAYRRCIELDPAHAIAHHNLGLCLVRREAFTDAFEMYRRSLELKPDYTNAWYNAGNLLMQTEKLDDATHYYRSALKHDPDHYRAMANLAAIALQQGDAAEALRLCDRVLAIAPDFHPAVNNRKVAQEMLRQATGQSSPGAPAKEEEQPVGQIQPSRIDPGAIVTIAMLVPPGEPVSEGQRGRIAYGVYRQINSALSDRLEADDRWERIPIGYGESPPNPEHGMMGFALAQANAERDRGHLVFIQGGLETTADARRAGLPSELWLLTIAKPAAGEEPAVGFVIRGPLLPAEE